MREYMFLLFIVSVIQIYAANVPVRSFQAKVTIYNDPNVLGNINGMFYYQASSDNKAISKRIDYVLGPVEYIFWNTSTNFRYMVCSSKCNAETYTKAIEHYYLIGGESTGSVVNINGRTCTTYTRTVTNDNQVQKLYLDTNQAICRAVFRNNKTIDFLNIVTSIPAGTFTINPQWGCPTPVCNVMMDIFYVFDESGSISDNDFQLMKNFGVNLTNSFTIGNNAVRVGVVLFDDDARLIIPISNNKQSIVNAILSVDQGGGYTCIWCGLQLANVSLPKYRSSGENVQKVVILMTDGVSNRHTSSLPSIVSTLQSRDITTFVIGVGNEIDEKQLKSISSNISNVQTYWYSPSYSQIGNLLSNGFISETCLDIEGSSCGSGCLGFCSCDSQCICPDNCTDFNPCTDDFCTAPNNGYGCQHTATNCDDFDPCTIDTCNSNLGGCQHTPVSNSFCNDNNPCTVDTCKSGIGCQFTPKNCMDTDACTIDSCNSTDGSCKHELVIACLCTSKICDFVDNCTLNECNPNTGNCTRTNVNCDDGNVCTIDLCDPILGCVYSPKNCTDNNLCTIDSCDPSVIGGCVHTFYNSSQMDDKNNCTIDSCDPSIGIQHNGIVCFDNDACTDDDQCNSIIGCVFTQKDCGTILQDQINTQCDVAMCNSSDSSGKGCYVGVAIGSKFDSCGVCFGKGLTCVSATTVSIGAGIIAAIVIAGVAVAALITAGSVGGVKYYQKYRTNLSSATSNPLYTERRGSEGVNPMYTDT